MVRDNWLRFNLPLEGQVHFMYLDVKGWVSTGVGNKIDQTAAEMSAPSDAERSASLNLANQLQWTDKNSGAVASPDQVAADWDAVKGRLDLAAKGHLAFEEMTQLRISNEEVFRVVSGKLAEMETVLKGRPEFTAFDTWPASAQLATMSMCWGMGPMFRFPTFQGHVAAANWTGAADECRFNPDEGTIRIRNKLDRAHFLAAAAVAAQGLPVGQLSVSPVDVLGVQHALWMLGFDPGPQDGGDGGRTQAGVKAFQATRGVEENGRWDDPATRTELSTALGEAGWLVV
ncbi:hypothetical protein Phou_056800 [Phytohabitans houttuyneae]|uniref:Peptidoglycan binding-like domain-containing protein n=2 Tax=Phytohabitans houttuyneae TaxID=1076126 RepID=A0A6V8KDI2_9ACTN|nr:hypothetical protein Phou_056800 [Phytohabitans houttuyneae]